MKTAVLAVTALLFSFAALAQSKTTPKTKPTTTNNGGKKGATDGKSAKADLPAMFNKFFELSDGDTADVRIKSKIALDICNADNTSKYCTYVAGWANIFDKKYDAALKLIDQLKKEHPDWAEVYFLHAQYLNYKEEDGAVEQAQKAIEMNPKLIYPVFFLASHFESEENYKLALKYYNLLEKVAPNHRSLNYNRAIVKNVLGDVEGALEDYAKVLQKNPKHFRALFNRSDIYLRQEKWEKAEADLNAFIQLVPDYADAYYYRGYARYKLKKADECCADMKKAAQLGNKSASDYATANCQ